MSRRLRDFGINLHSQTAIATTGNADFVFVAPRKGTLQDVNFSGGSALAASDTNYITFSMTNLGQAGAGSTAMLAASDANTTKATGGSALVQDGRRTLVKHGTAANLNFEEGDRIRIRAAVTGTLAGTVTHPAIAVLYRAMG